MNLTKSSVQQGKPALPPLQHKCGTDTEVARAGHWKENRNASPHDWKTTTPRLFLILSEWVRAAALLGRLADLSIGQLTQHWKEKGRI